MARSLASTGSPKSLASPSVAGRSPVSIFIVVDFPQPLEPRKPKISPRPMAKLTRFTAVKEPNRLVRSVAWIAGSPPGSTRGGISRAWRPPAAAPGKQRDECVLQVRGTGAFHELAGSAGGDDAARVHGDGPIEPLGLVHVGGGDQHAHAGPIGTDAVDQGPELLAGEGIDAGGRLVEDEEVGVVDQGAAEADLLLHAAGELAGGAVGEGPQSRGVEQGADAAARSASGTPKSLAKKSMFSKTLSSR